MPLQCYAVEGLKREHEEFKKEQPSEQVLAGFIVGAAAKTEHYEIASYQGLVEKARLMGQQEVARLLQENLRQEEQMARRVEQMGRQLGQQMIQSMGTHMGQQMGQQPPPST
jgi:ferritin-like metal-binding protein YciE